MWLARIFLLMRSEIYALTRGFLDLISIGDIIG
jgi:hypothetical protein